MEQDKIKEKLDEIRKEYNDLNYEVFKIAQERGGSLKWDEYLAVGGDRLEELSEEWRKLSPNLYLGEANRRELLEKGYVINSNRPS